MKKIINKLKTILNPYGKSSFILKMDHGLRLLDVGCGNDSAFRTKSMRSDIYYIGVDIGHANTGNKKIGEYADEMYVTSPEAFHTPIERLEQSVDYIISSHNLEHCQDRGRVLLAMVSALKVGGEMYLSFPSIRSQDFPSRKGPLNYYDEKEHICSPPNPDDIIKVLIENNCQILFSSFNHRPLVMAGIGFILEPLSLILNRTVIGTWQLYGFETIMWIKKY
jgi:hypothetical protein